MKRFVLASLGVMATMMSMQTPASARVDLRIDLAPPPPQEELVPAPRRGYVWAPGYWRWRDHRHVWVDGHWIREQRGRHWVADAWVPDGPRYRYVPGYWER